MRYMNSKDEYKDWDKFIDYTKILDPTSANTNILDVYPNPNYIGINTYDPKHSI